MALFTRHTLGVQTIYSDLKRRASEQSALLVGTPGSIGEREVRGQRFLYRQFYDPAGKKRADYIGPAGDADARERADSLRDAIELTNGLLADARLLARESYVRVDSRTNAILATLADHALFRAGAVLVGSHAYGALLNELGLRSSAYLTEDIDLARHRRLELDDDASLEKILEESTVPLSPVLGFDRKVPPTSFKAPGRDRLRVDLLVPASGREVRVARVPELHAHATALPYLGYLLDRPMDTVVIGRDSVVPVKVPRPERFALHKVLVSQLRASTSEKQSKDLQQAAVLTAAMAETDPGALEEAARSLPTSSRARWRRGASRVVAILAEAGDTRGAELLSALTA